MGENKSRKTIFSIIPSKSNIETGVQYEVYTDRLAEYFSVNKEIVIGALPLYEREGDRDGGEFGRGYFKNNEQIEEFLKQLNEVR